MSLTVKAYLERPATRCTKTLPEIRRFSVDQEVASSLDYLTTKISQAFPELGSQAYALCWKDPDNDKVAFSTDEELVEALGYVTDGVFRVHVTVKSTTTFGIDVLHTKIQCDGCEKPVRGDRFKCVVCSDYDLCHQCQCRGVHSEHDMLCIRTPGSRTPDYSCLLQKMEKHPLFAGLPPPPFGCFRGGPGPGGGGPGKWGNMPPQVRRWFRRSRKQQMWDQFCNAGEKEEKMASMCSEGKSRKEEPCRKNPSNDCPSQAAGDPAGAEPCGAEMEVACPPRPSGGRGGGRGGWGGWGSPWGWGGPWGFSGGGCGGNGPPWGGFGGGGPWGGAGGCEPRKELSQCDKSSTSTKPSPSGCMADNEMEEEEIPGEFPGEIPEEFPPCGSKGYKKSASACCKEIMAEVCRIEGEAGACQGEPLSRGDCSTKICSREGATPSSSDNDEAAPMVTEEVSRPRKHGRCPDRDRNYCERKMRLQKSLDKLMSMGFTNNGGMLRQLLVAKDGDIARVLQIIQRTEK